MSNWWNKEELTGWGADLKKAHKTVMTNYKTKIEKIVKGMKATPAIIKKTFKEK